MAKWSLIIFISNLLWLGACEHDSSDDPLLLSMPMLEINIRPEHRIQLRRKREEALQLGLLISKGEDYVPAEIKYQNRTFKAQVRLKGDWLDHLKTNRWSLRVQMDSSESIMGMRVFSLQYPKTRSYLDEYVFHQLLKEEGLLTTDYSFVRVRMNGRNQGIYALEEHFDRLLLEKQSRREAPIVKYNEDGFWEAQKYYLKHKQNLTFFSPIFEAAEIEAFQKNHMMADPILKGQFIYAIERMQELRSGSRSPLDILNSNDMARLFALVDVAQAYHTLRWHNLRFYYNPFTTKLEPILFDAYGKDGPYRWFSKPYLGYYSERYAKVYFREEYLVFSLFNDITFRRQYQQYLEKFTDPDYLENFFSGHREVINNLDRVLQSEFRYPGYQWNRLTDQADFLRNQLLTYTIDHKAFEYRIYSPNYDSCLAQYPLESVSLKADLSVVDFGDSTITLSNYFCQPITVVATGPKKKRPTHEIKPGILMPAFDIHNQSPQSTKIRLPEADRFVFYMIESNTGWYRRKISKQPASPLNTLFCLDRSNMDTSIFRLRDDTLFMGQGSYQLSGLQTTPKDITVVVEAGVNLDLVSGGGLMIQGPLLMLGSKKQPITITSSDGTALGWHVIGSENDEVTLAWVNFENMGTIEKDGSWLSGGITIYQSKLNMRNCHLNRFTGADALNIVSSDQSIIANVTFQNCKGDALDIDFSHLDIRNCDFENIAGDAVDCSASNVEAVNLNLTAIKDKGISIGEGTQAHLDSIFISRAKVGVAVKDGSTATAVEIEIEHCEYGMTCFNKKNHYAEATLNLRGYSCVDVDNCLSFEAGQNMIVDGKNMIETDTTGHFRKMFYEIDD